MAKIVDTAGKPYDGPPGRVEEPTEPRQDRFVLLATPTKSGELDLRYVKSLLPTLFASGVAIWPEWVRGDYTVDRARNKFLQVAYEKKEVTDLVFIDEDQAWTVPQFLRLLSHPVDFVGGTYRKRVLNREEYVVLLDGEHFAPGENGLQPVRGLGCGFMRLSRRAIDILYEKSPSYKDSGEQLKDVFRHRINDEGELQSEDITVCEKWRKLGETVWFDPELTVEHFDGPLTYQGDFKAWFKPVQDEMVEARR